MKIKESRVSFKAGPEDGLEEGEFLAYPSTFTKTPDSYGDVVKAGAFTETIKEWKASGNTLPGLFGHRMDDPDFYVASAVDMGEDEHGWWVKGKFDLQHPKAAQVYRLVKDRRLSQLSFAYSTIEEGKVELDGGESANELRKLKVHEFSFVPVGANPDTSIVAVKSAVDALLKAGRVLSAGNYTKLSEAHAAIGAVLEAATPEDPKSGDTESKSNRNSEDPLGNEETDTDEANVCPRKARARAVLLTLKEIA